MVRCAGAVHLQTHTQTHSRQIGFLSGYRIHPSICEYSVIHFSVDRHDKHHGLVHQLTQKKNHHPPEKKVKRKLTQLTRLTRLCSTVHDIFARIFKKENSKFNIKNSNALSHCFIVLIAFFVALSVDISYKQISCPVWWPPSARSPPL